MTQPDLTLLLLQRAVEVPVVVDHRPAHVLGHALAVRRVHHAAHWHFRMRRVGAQVVDPGGHRVDQLEVGQACQAARWRKPAGGDFRVARGGIVGEHHAKLRLLPGEGVLQLAEQHAVGR
ncbi:hypothetical protein D9M71_790730 [compost metagenome]